MIGPLIDNQSNGYWKYYYENQNLRMEGELLNNKKHNSWIYYHENGLIKSKGEYKKGIKNTTWMYYHEDGEFKAQALYLHGKGEYFEFYADGNIKMQGPIENDKSNGHWIYRFPDGTIESEGEERNGLKEGEWVFNYPDGIKKSEGSFSNGKSSGEWKHFHKNGNIKSIGKKLDDKKYGYWKVMFETGETQSETDYDKSESGEYAEFYESGKLKIKGAYSNGKHQGNWKYFYEDGTLEGNCNYNKGLGYYKGYFLNGNVRLEGNLDDGIKVGKWTMYDQKGNVTGYYKTYDKEEHPVFSAVTTHSNNLPSGHMHNKKKKKSFNKRLSSSKFGKVIKSTKPGLDGSIFEIHTLSPFLNQVGGSYEFWVNTKYGHQLTAFYTKNPLFFSSNNLYNTEGTSFNYRFKYYSKSLVSGYVHFDQELRFTKYNHKINFEDSTGNNINLSKEENLIEYAVLFGNRYLLTKSKSIKTKNKGWTMDTYVGFGIGYRLTNSNWNNNSEYDSFFSNISNSPISIPLRLGITIGYVF